MVRPSLELCVRYPGALCLAAQITAALWLVDGAATLSRAGTAPRAQIVATADLLPEPVAAMRAAILEAVARADIEEIVQAIEMNEIPPMIGPKDAADPIAWLKEVSIDKQGIETLARLSLVLEAPAARVDVGTPREMYVWPHLAELALAGLAPADRIALYRLVGGREAERMLAAGRYTGLRLGIGANGVWHWLEEGE